MKQKLFLGALLLGALTLNSCVDDTESASVTAVRQAKAEQLKSLADLNKANAEAALISANATKAAQEAIAEYNKALTIKAEAEAEYQRALAAYQDARTEAERARAAQEAAQAQVDLERAQADLENHKKYLASLDAQYEKDLYNNQLEALKAKKAYEAAIKAGEKDKINELLALLEEYQTAADELLAGQKTLALWKNQLAYLEAGLVSPNQTAENMIRTLTLSNNNLNDYIQEANAYITTWRDNDYATAEAALADAKKDLSGLKKDLSDKEAARTAANTKAANAKYVLDGSEYAKAISKVENLGQIAFDYSTSRSLYVEQISKYDADAPAEVLGNWCAVIKDNNNGKTYMPLFSTIDSESKSVNYEVVGQPYVYTVSYTTYSAYNNLVAGGMDKLVATAKEFVKNGAEKELATATKNVEDYDKNVKEQQANYDKLVELKATYDAAVEAQEKAESDADGKLAKAVEDAKKAFYAAAEKAGYGETYSMDYIVSDCLSSVNTAKSEYNVALEAKNTAENNLNSENKKIEAIEASAKTLADGNEANTAAIDAVNEANVAKANAELAYYEASNAVNVKKSEISALEAKVNATDDDGYTISYIIKQKEENIKSWTKQIENNNYQIEVWQKDLEVGKLTQETTIENLKADIANQEAKVLVLEKKAEYAKSELDKAMEAEKPAE